MRNKDYGDGWGNEKTKIMSNQETFPDVRKYPLGSYRIKKRFLWFQFTWRWAFIERKNGMITIILTTHKHRHFRGREAYAMIADEKSGAVLSVYAGFDFIEAETVPSERRRIMDLILDSMESCFTLKMNKQAKP